MTGKEESEVNDCLSCKVTSTVTLLSIGAYLIYQGRIQKSSKYGLYTMGTVVAALGLGVIFDKSPFR